MRFFPLGTIITLLIISCIFSTCGGSGGSGDDSNGGEDTIGLPIPVKLTNCVWENDEGQTLEFKGYECVQTIPVYATLTYSNFTLKPETNVPTGYSTGYTTTTCTVKNITGLPDVLTNLASAGYIIGNPNPLLPISIFFKEGNDDEIRIVDRDVTGTWKKVVQ